MARKYYYKQKSESKSRAVLADRVELGPNHVSFWQYGSETDRLDLVLALHADDVEEVWAD